MPNISIVIPTVVAALIALLVYLYRNRIGFDVAVIDLDVENASNELTLNSSFGKVQAERLTIKSYGLRTLENVELHYEFANDPKAIVVRNPTTVSKTAIKTDWSDKQLKVTIPTLPRGEQIIIDTLRVGHYQGISDRVRGTGGKYKIVRIDNYESWRRFYSNLALVVWLLLCFVVAPRLDSQAIPPASSQKAAANAH